MPLNRIARTAASLRVMINPHNPLRPQEAEEVVAYYEWWVSSLIERLERECGSTAFMERAIIATVCTNHKWVSTSGVFVCSRCLMLKPREVPSADD